MLIEERKRRMYDAERGKDYVTDRFFQDLHRPSGFFEMESKLRVILLTEIKEQTKQSKQSNAHMSKKI